MILSDKLKLKELAIYVDGEEVEAVDQVTDDGLESAASCLGSPFNYSDSWMPFIGIGSGVTDPSSGDTTLETELHRKRGSVSVVSNTYFISADFGLDEPVGDCTIREVAIFDAISGGNMAARWTFAVANWIDKDAIDIVTILCAITLV